MTSLRDKVALTQERDPELAPRSHGKLPLAAPSAFWSEEMQPSWLKSRIQFHARGALKSIRLQLNEC